MNELLTLVLSVVLTESIWTKIPEHDAVFAALPPECASEYEPSLRQWRNASGTRICRCDLDGDGEPEMLVWTGEGGSGGAIALATANRLLMLSNSIYSVISPEGCASILWRDGAQAQKAAEALHLTAADLKNLGVIDEIVHEPLGGAHRAKEKTIAAVGDALFKHLKELMKTDRDKVRRDRAEKFLKMTRMQ